MVKYYDKFTPGLASKCAVLNDLLCKDAKWKWSKQHSKAVEVIKTALTSTETLTQELPLNLACNTSTVIVGAVIFHTFPDGKERPIAYASRKLLKAEKNYARIQKEALAIIYGVQKFRQYLIGRKFCLITDHNTGKQSNVLLIIDQEITHNLIVFWLNILMAKFRRSSHKFSESDYESGNSRILFRITLIQFSEFSKICGI